MTALLVVLWTVMGFAGGAFLLGEMAPLFGIRDMEGQSGIFGMLVGGPLGAIAGGISAVLIARHLGDDRRRKSLLLVASLAVLVAIPLAVWLFESWRTHDHLTTRPNTWSLGFQVRLPPDQPSPAGEKIEVELRSPKEDLVCPIYQYPHGLSREGERFVISGGCPLFFATPTRRIRVRIGAGPTLIFDLRVKAHPEAATYSDWFAVDRIQDPGAAAERAPGPQERYDIRYGAR